LSRGRMTDAAKEFSASTMSVMEVSDPEDSVCIELETIGENKLELENDEDVDPEDLYSDEVDGQDEIYETEESYSVIEGLLNHRIVQKGKSTFSVFVPALALFGIFCIICYPVLVLSFKQNDNHVWNYNREQLGDIYLTKEYQLTLPQELFIPRDVGLTKVLEKINEITGLDVYNVTKYHLGVRSQYKYNPWNCTNWQDIERYEYSEYMSALYYEQYGHGYYDEYGVPLNETNDHDEDYLSDTEIRVRNWLSVQVGSNLHTSSIDIKKQVPNQDDAFAIPFRAADDQLDGSTEKLEEDIKPKKYQWSHKSKVTNVPYYPSFETCRDVMKYWPNCFPDLPEEKYDDIVERKTKSENYWWEDLRESTDARSGLKWRLTVTMEYETFAQALEGRTHPIDEPESSFRIWSTEGGHGPWDPRVVNKVNQWYERIVDEFKHNKNLQSNTDIIL